MRKLLIITIGLIALFLPLSGAFGLEISYPTFGGANPGNQGQGAPAGPAKWVQWIYFAALGLVGVAAVGSLIYAGIVWMTSTSEGRIASAKKQIWAALLGVVLVVGSWVLLNTINPDLVDIKNPALDPNIFKQPQQGIPPPPIPPPGGPGTGGQACLPGGTCKSGTPMLVCNTSVNKCLIPLGGACFFLGGICDVGAYCESPNNFDGTCTSKKVPGDQCDSKYNGIDCVSGFCQADGICQ